jgi:hypothetical protein
VVGGCGACWEKIYEYKILVGNMKERDSLENLGVYGRMFKKYYWTMWIEFIWLRTGRSVRLF